MFNAQIKSAKAMLDSYDISNTATLAGAITYGKAATLALPLGESRDRDSVKRKFDSLANPGSGNNMGAALQMARSSLFSQDNGAREGVPRSLVVFVSEKFSGNPAELGSEARALKEAGVKIIAVGLGSEINKDDVASLASDNDAVFFPPSLEEMDFYLYPIVQASLPSK